MGLTLCGQVQPAVGRIEVGVSAVTVGETFDADRPEDARKGPDVAGLDRAVRHPICVDDLDAGLANRAQVQVLLEHAAQQFPAPLVEMVFEVTVVKGGRFRSVPTRRSSQ